MQRAYGTRLSNAYIWYAIRKMISAPRVMISLKVPAQSDPQKEAVSCLGFDTINKVFPQRDPGPARSKSAALAGNDDGIQEKLSDTHPPIV